MRTGVQEERNIQTRKKNEIDWIYRNYCISVSQLTSKKNIILLVIFSALILLSVVQFKLWGPTADLDPSFVYSLASSYDYNYQFGQDLIFTYGPYFNLMAGINFPRLYNMTLFLGILISIFYIFIIFNIIDKNINFHCVFIFLIPLIGMNSGESIYYVLPIITIFKIILDFDTTNKNNIFLLILSLIIFSLFTLIKSTYLFYILFIQFILYLYLIYIKKYNFLIISIITFYISFIFFWTLAGQQISNIFNFIYYSYLIASTHTEAMSLFNNFYLDIIFLFFNIVLLIIFYKEIDLKLIDKIIFFLLISSFLLILFKASFVRNDYGHIANYFTILIHFFLIFPLIFKFKKMNIRIFSGTIIILFIFVQLVIFFSSHKYRLPPLIRSINGIYHIITEKNYFINQYTQSKNNILNEYHLPNLPGTSDLYTYDQALLLVTSNKWNPRIAFQSYMAYHPALLKLNVQHLLDKYKAPDNIFYKIGTIDHRLVTIEDGISFPVILNYYNLIGEYKDYLILNQNQKNKIFNIEENLRYSSKYNLNDRIDVSQYNNLIYISFTLQKSLIGDLANFIYKITPIYIIIELENGLIYFYRIIPSMCETGFLISPLIRNKEDFKYLYNNKNFILKNNKVKYITITSGLNSLKIDYLSKNTDPFWLNSFTLNIYTFD
ncbi:MAG: hypothetical protein LBR53_04900 [Deltaproteobacteria bacterium]|jgi:hypothetical protein|nr:hypothetical protein [Deltaproteobacteria bacterium]